MYVKTLFCLPFSRNIENKEYHTEIIPHHCYTYIQVNSKIQHVPADKDQHLNTTGATSGAGTPYPSEAPMFTPGF